MGRLALFLLALPLVAAIQPTASSLVTDPGAIGYSTITLQFDTPSSAWTNWRLRINPSASCAAGAGTLQAGPASGGTVFTSGYRIIAGGLNLNQHYWLCVELSDDGGGTFSVSGASGEVQGTTLAVVENEPRPVKKFDQRIPDTGDFATMPLCGVGLNAQGYCRINEAPGTTDISTDYDQALTDQCSHGTIIALNPSATPVVFTHNIYSSIFASCSVLFFSPSSITGNTIDFGFAHGLTEGQLLTFGNHGFHSSPSSSSCYFGNGFNTGARFLVHVTGANTITLVCGDKSNNPVVITSAGDYPSNQLFFLPHVDASGMCRDVSGLVPCNYKKVNSYKVIVRTATPDALVPPQGTRITPAFFAAGLGAILVNPIANINSTSSTAAFLNSGNNDGNNANMVANVIFGPGLEITNQFDTGDRPYCIVALLQRVNSDITIDRMYLHGGDTKPPNLQRWGGPSCQAMEIEGYNTSIQDSWIDNMRYWMASSGLSGSSSTTSEGPGPIMITNNWWEGAGAPLYHMDNGGGQTYISGDVTLLRNTFYSPTFMMDGSPDSDGHPSGLRQSVEIKGIWGNESRGNRFINTWVGENPNGEFFVITSVSPPGGIGEGAIDINISDNIFSHGPGGIGSPVVVYGGGRVTIPPARFRACNNLFYGIEGKWVDSSSPYPPKGWWYQGPGGGEGQQTCHNTWVGNTVSQPVGWIPVISRVQSGFFAGWKFNDNFIWNMQTSGWGFQREGGIGVDACFNKVGQDLADCMLTPSYEWKNNVFMSPTGTAANIAAQWPGVIVNNYNPTNMSLSVTPGWTKYDATGDNGNYRLLSTSNYRSGATKTLTTGPASDGSDVGVDMTKLLNATGHVQFASISPIGTTTASVNFSAPDNLSCLVYVTSTAPWTSASVPTSGVTPFPDSGTAPGARKVDLTGLASGTLYYGIVNCQVEQPTFQFKTASAVQLSSICAAGTGGTDTTCLQTAFNTTAGANQILEIPPAASVFYNTNRLTCPNNLNVLFDSGTHVKVVSGIGTGVAIIDCDNATGVTLRGTPGSSSIEGRKSEYTSDENRHCMRFAGATNVVVSGLSCNESGGDGIYIGEGTRGYAQNVEVANSTFNHNSRNAMSIISCNICNVHDSTFSNTIGENGAAAGGPWAGIDIEPNVNTNRLVNIALTNLTLSGNGLSTDHAASNGNGLTVHFDLLDSVTTPAVSITGTNLASISNVNTGFHVTNEHDTPGIFGPSGTITITNSHATTNGMYGTRAFFYDAAGPIFTYSGSTNTNNNVLGTTINDADMSIERGGGAGNPMGGVHWTGDSITSTNGNLQYYFDVEDSSGIGLANIQIGTFGTLSGRTGSTNGLLSGSGVASVSIP